jgi:hypothetical protein
MRVFLIFLFYFILNKSDNISYYWDDKFIHYQVEITKRTITGGKTQISLSSGRFKKFAIFNPSIRKYELPNTTDNLIIEVEDPFGNVGKPINGYLDIKQLDDKTIEGSFEMEIEFKNPKYRLKISKGYFQSSLVLR